MLILRVMLGVLVLCLTACQHGRGSAPGEQAAMDPCLAKCEQRYVACSKVCSDTCKECADLSYQQAAKRFNQYRREQQVQGAEFARTLPSYRDQLQCRKTTCECKSDYNICKQACAGKIHKRLKIAPTCC